MKHMFFRSALLIAAGFVAASAVPSVYAQAAPTMRVHVPFEFQAAGKALPAGTYIVEVEKVYRRVDLRSEDGKMLFLASNPSPREVKGPSKLVFHRYGNTYFLRAVLDSNHPIGHELPLSKAERGLANVAGVRPVVETVYGGGMR